jgi:hypothetical protein
MQEKDISSSISTLDFELDFFFYAYRDTLFLTSIYNTGDHDMETSKISIVKEKNFRFKL